MAITSAGIGSGLDINSIISQLMSLERRPIALLDQKEAVLQARLTGYGQLKGALSTFQSAVAALASPAKFSTPTASVADTTVLSVTPGATAAAGAYDVEVTQLAKSQKLLATGQATQTTAIGAGTLTFDFGTITGGALTPYDPETGIGGSYTGSGFTSNGSGTKEVVIDSGNSSLAGIRDAINAANIGVTAAIINDGDATNPYRLVLSSSSTGLANSLKISVTGDAALSDLLAHDPDDDAGQALQETVTAQNALVMIDGVLVSKSSNTVTDAIPGATMNLLKTNEGSPTRVALARDSAGIKSAVEAFVKAYNDASKMLADISKYDPKTKQSAILQGDSAVRQIQSSMRSVLNSALSTAGGGLTTLSDIGVTFQKDGTLALSSTKLQTAIDDTTKDIATLFAALGKPSDALVSFVSSTESTKNGDYAVDITRLATQGAAVGDATVVLMTVGGGNNTLTATIDGVAVSVTLAAGDYDPTQLATEIQSKLNGASALSDKGITVAVTQAAGILSITSSTYGSDSKVQDIAGNAAAEAFGTVDYTNGTGLNVAGSIGGISATGSGQTLTGTSGDSVGLALKIIGGATGARGTVKFAQGFAYQLDKLVGKFLATDGTVATRTDGISKSVDLIDDRRAALERRLVQVEQRYRAQFTALDLAMASMTSTSSFLAQQLANLPNNNSNR